MINKKKVLIICEGFEELEYLEALIKLNIWPNYDIYLKNAKSNGHIFAMYQFYFQNDDYDLILIMADTDRPTYDDFNKMLNDIDSFHGKNGVANEIVIFGNPCTMQFILNHFSNDCIYLTKANKKKNVDIIYKLTKVENYDAHSSQRKMIFDKINKDNYETMKKNISQCDNEYNCLSSTNFLKFINRLESNDYGWIDEINKKMD